MGQLAEALLSSSGWAALALLFMLPALEAPAFLGLVLPGELVLLLGGVLASQGRIPLAAALAVGVAGALAGDSAGYWIGHRWDSRLLTSRLGAGSARPACIRSSPCCCVAVAGPWWWAAAPPAPGSCSRAWPACLGYATASLSSGPVRPPSSGRPPMSCSGIWPAPVGATSTSSPAGSASRSPWRWWSSWPSPGCSAARPGDTRTSHASLSPQGGATRPAAGGTQQRLQVGRRRGPAMAGRHQGPWGTRRVRDGRWLSSRVLRRRPAVVVVADALEERVRS
jgi:hypothetical protein